MRLPSLYHSMCACIGLVLIIWAIAFTNNRILSADGSYYLAMIADWHGFVLVGWHRSNAQFATQWLPVYGARLLDASLEELVLLYSLNVYIPAVISFLLCVTWLRQAPTLLIFPILSFILLELNSTFIIMGEHHMLMLTVWPILAFCLFPRNSWWYRLIFIGLCLFSTRLYEAGFVLLAIPCLLCLNHAWTHKNRVDRWFWLVAAIILATGVAIAIDGIIHPRDVGNYQSFRKQMVIAFGSPLAQACLVMTIAVCATLYFGTAMPMVAGTVVAVCVLVMQHLTGHKITAVQSFSARTFSVSVIPWLMVAAIAHARLAIGRPLDRRMGSVFMVFVGFTCCYSLVTELHWHRIIGQLQGNLATHSGFLPLSETGLDMDEFVGHYTLPTMSIIMSERCVGTILSIPDGYWLPYDLTGDKILGHYRQYSRDVNGTGCSR